MNTLIIIAAVAVKVAALDPSNLAILLPTAKPTGPQDNWECALSAYTPFFNPPKPTGTLLSAIGSYGDKLLEPCTELVCPFPDATKWCAFTTAAPTAVLPAYTSYASSASVWWTNHSSSAIELAEECPHYWYDAMTNDPSAGVWLNQTIINGECIAKPPSSASSSKSASASSSSALRSSSASASSVRASSVLVSSSTKVSSSATASSSSSAVKISPDGTCAGIYGYSCPGSGFGECCSSYGWCGNDVHCDSGCNPAFGLCNAPTMISPDGTCGTVNNNNGWICPGSGFGDCCSAYGYCGVTADHCSATGGCQTAYGTCNVPVNGLTAREIPTMAVEVAVTRAKVVLETLLPTGKA